MTNINKNTKWHGLALMLLVFILILLGLTLNFNDLEPSQFCDSGTCVDDAGLIQNFFDANPPSFNTIMGEDTTYHKYNPDLFCD